MPLSAESTQAVKSILDDATKQGPTGVNGLVFVAVDKNGETLVEHASGTRSVDSEVPMDMDTNFWIASCTKLVAVIAVMQLVEKGRIPLDDAHFIQSVAPEIAAKKVYADGVNGVTQERGVTMRMLLSHTCGFAYSFLDPRVGIYGRPVGIEEFHGDVEDVMRSPMVNQPGSTWEYGTGIDWAGIILERHTGQKLGDYMQENIFEPLGISGATMFPTEEMQSNLAYMHQRDPSSGALAERAHLYRRSFRQTTKEQQQSFFQSGGAGLFAKPKEYVKILTALLNGGASPTTGNRILEEKTVDLMWENQIPDQPNFARDVPPTPEPLLANSVPEFYPQENNPAQGWGFCHFLTIAPGATGRGANTAWWCGLSNLFWWCDREKGVAGMIAGQILPFADAKVLQTWGAAEKAVYDGLK